jgi:hypothetical protein
MIAVAALQASLLISEKNLRVINDIHMLELMETQ